MKITNLVRTIGIIPTRNADPIPVGKIPDGGTQVAKEGSAAGADVIVHTVTSGKTLYLSACSLGIKNGLASTSSGYLGVRNASDTWQYMLLYTGVVANDGKTALLSFPIPLEIPAGYDIVANSSDADVQVYAFIHGYEM